MADQSNLIQFQNENRTYLFVIGIDLGTTNSLIAVAGKDNQQNLLPILHGEIPPEGSFPNFIPVHLLQLPQINLDGTVASHVLFPSVVFQDDPAHAPIAGLGAKEAKYRFRRGRNVFYSVKMDLGTDRDPFYPGAVSDELNTPVKVSAVILKSMREAAEKQVGGSLKDVPVVITIPASFQSSQRRDTLDAAQLAGFNVNDQCLFDEPNAALLAYMNRQRVQLRWNQEETVLVFDFGGGTCDISIIDVSFSPVRKTINLRSLAISRFEQLGGDDIDKHYVHTVLKKKFYEASRKEEREWALAERQHSIWSQLSKIAELLKIRFCEELDRVAQLSDWNENKLAELQVTIPPQIVETSQGPIQLNNLSLNWNTFKKLMDPFLDPSGSKNEDKEYYRITSIFSPIKDAIEKCGLENKDITRILLVGGSARNPYVEHAIQIYFSEAAMERPKDMDYLVAEGAAVHAFMRYILGHDILAPIVGDTIGLLVEGNQFVQLIPAGSPIPFPDLTGWMSYTQFRVPKERMTHVDLIFCAGSISRPVHTVRLTFGREIPQYSRVHLKIRLDGNKILFIEASLPDFPDIHVKEMVDNPLGLLPMTSKQRERAELENLLSKAQHEKTLDQYVDEMEHLAEVLVDLDRNEQALGWVDQAIRRRGEVNPRLKRLKARIHGSLGENEQAHALYAELSDQHPGDAYVALDASLSAPNIARRETYIKRAVQASPNDGFCLYFYGFLLRDQGQFSESRQTFEKACQILERAIQHYPNHTGYLSYLVSVLEELGDATKANLIRQRLSEVRDHHGDGDIDTSHVVGIGNFLKKV